MPESSFKSVIITATILFIGCLGFGLFFARPQWQQYSQNKLQLAQLTLDNDGLKQALNALQSFLGTFESQKDNVTKVNLSLPIKSPDLANFMSAVADLAASSGTALSDFSIGSERQATANAVAPVTLNLSASGSYQSFSDFILRLQNNLRLVDINHVTLQLGENNLLKYSLELQTYYQK